MLKNGLGELLLTEAAASDRFVDLFSGSGAVAAFVASRVPVRVVAFDLQKYSCVLAGATLQRTEPADHQLIWRNWRRRAARYLEGLWIGDSPPQVGEKLSKRDVEAMRLWSSTSVGSFARAYGGHYFSPDQALWIDALRSTVDYHEPSRTLELAALLDAASECAASPGHTAQPFQPTTTSLQYIHLAWNKDVVARTRDALRRFSSQFSMKKGASRVGDANVAAGTTKRGDLVFVDPPYSALQYSRFYHVLEAIVSGSPGIVTGVGRYPSSEQRPRSAYSVKSEATKAITGLLQVLASRGANVILTFPDHACSNGLSGEMIRNVARGLFNVSEIVVKSKLSTLGGTGEDCITSEKRGARRSTSELILLLRSAESATSMDNSYVVSHTK